MKKTEWFYNHNKKQWWLVNVTTNAEHIPKIRLGDRPKTCPVRPVQVKGLNLRDENKSLIGVILALAGCLGIALGAIVLLLVT